MVYVFDFKDWDPNRPMSSTNANVLISAPGIDAVEVQVPSDPESEHGYWLKYFSQRAKKSVFNHLLTLVFCYHNCSKVL